jgi:S-DNA-T family DNA segregation ATPase FtsK/SpoIIIE
MVAAVIRLARRGLPAVPFAGRLFGGRHGSDRTWSRSRRRIMALIEDRSRADAEATPVNEADEAPSEASAPAAGRRRPSWLAGFGEDTGEEPEVSMGYGDARHLYEEEAVAEVEPVGTADAAAFEAEEPTELLDRAEMEALARRDRGWDASGGEVAPEDAAPEDAADEESAGDEIGEDADEDELEVVYSGGGFVDPDEDFDPAPAYARASAPARRRGYEVPVDGLLDEYHQTGYWEIDEETRESAEVLRYTLEEFSIQAEVTGIRKGPVITMFEILPAPGVKLARITNLADNIALRLAASSVRIVAPIPGKHAVGIEIPNKQRHIVSFMELIRQDRFWSAKQDIPLALGKDIPGDVEIVDLTKTPHLLIAGATGSGKSVCVNSIICSILYRRSPQEVKMMLIDPKIVELKFYNDIPHLLTPVITDPKRAFQALQYCIYEMERRYNLLDSLGVRDIGAYNEKIKKRNLATEPLPYIVVVVDELADLMTTSGKELESTLARLAAMSRAVGIHLVLATQRPSTDVITGLIKANIPSRIAFMVSSKVDSRIIIDTGGAEKLLGQGDMLFTSAWDPFPTRMQGAFLSDAEVERVVEHVKTLGEPEYIDDEIFVDDDEEEALQGELEDPLMEKAIDIVVTANKASASYLQRRLKIGYNRAARLVEEMERIGVVGPQRGSKPRDVLGAPEA